MQKMLMRGLSVVLLVCAGLGLWWFFSHVAAVDDAGPVLETANPENSQFGVSVKSTLKATFRNALKPSTVSGNTFSLRDSRDNIVPATVQYQPATHLASLKPNAPLEYSAKYRVTIAGGQAGVLSGRGKRLANDLTWTFTTGAPPAPSPDEGPGGPILIISSSANPFSRFYAEILRSEGFNEFAVSDISLTTTENLNRYDVVILGEFPITAPQVSMLTDWVRQGGNLIAMRPDQRLAAEIGLKRLDNTLKDGYVSIDTSKPPGIGLANETLQFHGVSDLYETKDEGDTLATLYKSAVTGTSSPAVSLKKMGTGLAAAFTYDLARSVAYTRQGNPEWEGEERDGLPPIRSDDLFYGAASFDPHPDWIDFNKVAIPQADIQQRLLCNLMLYMNLRKKPLPRFWYFPHGFKAVVIMTGDDHGHGGTLERFLHFQSEDRAGCSLSNWQCIRGTSNIFVGSVEPAAAVEMTDQGFEIGLHVDTDCHDWPSESFRQQDGTVIRRVLWRDIDDLYSRQLAAFAEAYPGLPAPRSNRIDCITWGDYDTQPQAELAHGIRLDTNYYYWPPKWVVNRPGMFTGSGMPMRFVKLDGTLIDVYQVATQMTDESGQTYPYTIDTLLSNALGPKEYYGAFTANMHTDRPESPGADAIIAAAKSRGVPIISAAQMLEWLDGRNGSSFKDLQWNGRSLEFTVSVGTGGNGIQAMLPLRSGAGVLNAVSMEEHSVAYGKRSFAGVEYAEFAAPPGRYKATYSGGRH